MTISRTEALGRNSLSSGALLGNMPLLSGAAAGLLGGLVMALYLVLLAGTSGMTWLLPLQAIGATIVGSGGPAQAVAGALLHALASGAFGLLYAAIFPRDYPPPCAFVVGAGYALFVLAMMASVVVPEANPSFRGAMQPIGGTWVVAHALYGATLALASRRS